MKSYEILLKSYEILLKSYEILLKSYEILKHYEIKNIYNLRKMSYLLKLVKMSHL